MLWECSHCMELISVALPEPWALPGHRHPSGLAGFLLLLLCSLTSRCKAHFCHKHDCPRASVFPCPSNKQLLSADDRKAASRNRSQMCGSPLQVKAAENTDEESRSLGTRRVCCGLYPEIRGLGKGLFGMKGWSLGFRYW